MDNEAARRRPADTEGRHQPSGDIAISIRGLSKVFPGTRALTDVDIDLRFGEVLALCGGNGSGKSTLIKILCGAQPADAGTVTLAGETFDATQIDAKVMYQRGLRVVHQDPPLFPDMTVAENLMLGAVYPTNRFGSVRWKEVRSEANRLIQRFEIPAGPNQLMRELPVATRTQTVIARALRDVDEDSRSVIILDEPTAALPVHEVALLIAAVRRLAAQGHAIVFVSHRLDEVLALTDCVTVLRDGRVYKEHRTKDLTEEELIDSILGKRVTEVRSRRGVTPTGATTLKIKGLCAGPVADLDLELRAGEVVGIAGLLGSGRTELLSAIYGQLKINSGSVEVGGRTTRFKRASQAIDAGVVMVPEDRARGAVFADMSVDENMNLSVLERYWFGLGFRRAALQRDADDLRQRFRVKAASGLDAIAALSGGNQQKAVLARWLRRKPQILLLDEPTQGVDVGARADIYALVREATEAGGSAIVVTSDFEELAQFVDRAIVLRNGRAIAEVGSDDLSAHRLNQLLYAK